MAEHNTPTTLNGMFKEVYADKIKDLVPDGVKLYNMTEFVKDSKKQGNKYHQPVVLGLEHGVTYGGPDGNAFALNSAIAGVMKDAEVQGYEMVLRSAISVGAASRSIQSHAAFEKTTKYLVANMLRSITRRLEIALFYGQSGIGKVESITAASDFLIISADSWAPGIWAGAEGMTIECYTGDTLHDAYITVSVVDFATRKITYVPSANDTAIAADDDIYYRGAKDGSTLNEFAGLYKICTNTGTLFNISAASYSLWKGNNISTAADISFSLLESGIAQAVGKGLADEDVVAFVNVDHWNVLLDDIVAKRQFDSSYNQNTASEGTKAIEFFGQNGMIKVVPSIYVKGSHAFIIPLSEFSRVGSMDVTFEQPGFEGEFFRLLNDNNGYELRAYTDQALFCAAPGKCIVFSDLNIPS